MTGALAPLLADATLSAVRYPDPAAGRVVFSSQTHQIGDSAADPAADGTDAPEQRGKKAEREDQKRKMRAAAARTGWGSTLPWERNKTATRARDELADGLTFPGLWVGEDNGKSKEFCLELSLGKPADHGEQRSEPVEQAPAEPPDTFEPDAPIDTALHTVLGADIEPLMLEDKLDEVIEPPPADVPKPWARFVSDPLTIVSKPSQKTAKARSMASCLSSSDAFSLVVRVNGQTVRTKYMKIDHGAAPVLCARTGKWSPFRFEVVTRAAPPDGEDRGSRARFKMDSEREKSIVTYGSIVRLVDVKHGTRSDPFRLVRVDKNEAVVGADFGHPVSELQRVGLVRVVDGEDDTTGGARWYLSAPGAVTGAAESTTRARPAKKETEPAEEPATLGAVDLADLPLGETSTPPAAPARKKKTKRHALARAAVNEEEEGSTAAGLVWHRAQRREGDYTVTEGKVATTRTATIETVNDWMCWVLSGVCE